MVLADRGILDPDDSDPQPPGPTDSDRLPVGPRPHLIIRLTENSQIYFQGNLCQEILCFAASNQSKQPKQSNLTNQTKQSKL